MDHVAVLTWRWQCGGTFIIPFVWLNQMNLFFQGSKKFFKRADLVRKEQEEYFQRCGYKVGVKGWANV